MATPLLLLIAYHVVTFMLEDQKTAHKQCAVKIFMLLKWNCLKDKQKCIRQSGVSLCLRE